MPSDGDPLADKSEEDKENMPLKRRAKKLSSKKRLSSGLDGSEVPRLTASPQTGQVVVHLERTPFLSTIIGRGSLRF